MLRGTVLCRSPMGKAAAGRVWHSMQCVPTAGRQSPRGQIAGRCRPMNALEATARQSRQRTRRNRVSPLRLLWLSVQPSIPFGPSPSLPWNASIPGHHSRRGSPHHAFSGPRATSHEPPATGVCTARHGLSRRQSLATTAGNRRRRSWNQQNLGREPEAVSGWARNRRVRPPGGIQPGAWRLPRHSNGRVALPWTFVNRHRGAAGAWDAPREGRRRRVLGARAPFRSGSEGNRDSMCPGWGYNAPAWHETAMANTPFVSGSGSSAEGSCMGHGQHRKPGLEPTSSPKA